MIDLFTDLTGKYQLLLLANTGYTASSTSAAIAQLGLWKSVKIVTAALWEQAKAFLATPIGWIFATTVAIYGIAKAVDWCTTSYKEHVENLKNLKNEYEEVKSNLENIESEIESVSQKMRDLSSINSPTLVEENELKQLTREVALLKTKKTLLEETAALKQNETEKTFNEAMDAGGFIQSAYASHPDTSDLNWFQKFLLWFNDEYSGYGSNSFVNINDLLDEYSSSETSEERKGEIHEALREQLNKFQDLESGIDYSTASEATKENLDLIYDFYEKYFVVMGNIEDAWISVFGREKYAEATNALTDLSEKGELTGEKLASLYGTQGNENLTAFINHLVDLGLVNFDASLIDKIESVDGATKDGVVTSEELTAAFNNGTISSKDLTSSLNSTAVQLNETINKIEDAAGATDNLANKFKKLSEVQKGIKSLNDAIKDLRDDGRVSFNTLSDIQENFSNLGVDSGKLSEYISQLAKATSESEISEILTDLSNAAIDAKYSTEELANADENVIAAMLREAGVANALEVAHARVTEAKILNILNSKDLKNATLDGVNQLLAEANILPITASQYQIYRAKKIAANALTANNSKSISALLTEANAANNLGKGYAVLQKLKDAYDTFERTKDPRGKSALASRISSLKQELQQVLNSVSIKPVTIKYSGGSYSSSSSSSSSSTDKHKDEFDDWLAEIKHRLEMDEITQEQYLDELNKKYQKYFSDLTKYQEEYWKYQEEVYDGVKELYKEELEAQKEALEEKLDALKEFYDEQKKMLEDQFEEEDYLKEQAEKRRAVTDIETQILLLSSDNSAWAQKRILELQEELQSANEELAEFEKDKYREDATQMYDDLYSAAEEETNNKIQAIDDILNDSNAVQKEILKRIDYMSNGGAIGDYSDWLSSSGSTSSGSSGSTDTSISIPDSEKVSLLSGNIGEGSSKAKLKILQSALNDLGYDCGVVDGIWGTKTANALKAFQKANGLTADGVCGSATKAKFALKGYAQGTRYAPEGLAITDENGYEMKLINPSRGKYQLLNQGDVIFNAAQSSFLWGLSKNPNGVLANLMSSILHRAPTLGGLTTASVQHIDIDTGDVIIQGNADEKTVSEIRRVKREMVNDVLKAFKQYAK